MSASIISSLYSMMTEEEHYVRLVQYFSMYTEFSATRIEEMVHEIMDNPEPYPAYFN